MALLLTLAGGSLFFWQKPVTFVAQAVNQVATILRLNFVRISLTVLLIGIGTLLISTADIYLWSGIICYQLATVTYLIGRDEAEMQTGLTYLLIVAIIAAQIARLIVVYVAVPGYDEALYIGIDHSIRAGNGLVPAASYIKTPITIYPYHGFTVALHAVWTSIFGSSLLAIRWLSFVYGSMMLIGFYLLVKLWHGRNSALAAVAVLSWGWMVFRAMRGRPIALPMLAVVVILLLYIWVVRKDKPDSHHFYVGLATLFLMEAHATLITVAVAFSALYFARYLVQPSLKANRLKIVSAFWHFGFGALVAASIYIGLRLILIGVDEYFTVINIIDYRNEQSYIVELVQDWRARIGVFLDPLGRPQASIEALLILSAAAFCIWKPSIARWTWLFLFCGALIAFTFADSLGNPFYLIFLAPLAFVGVGDMLVRVRTILRSVLLSFLLVLLAGLQVRGLHNEARLLMVWENNFERQFQPFVNRYPDGATIIGNATLHPYLINTPYTFHSIADDVARLGPGVEGIPYDAYWANHHISEWPQGYFRIRPISALEQTTDSFFRARREDELAPQSFIIVRTAPDDPVTRVPVMLTGQNDPPIQLVGYSVVLKATDNVEIVEVYTIWVTGQEIEQPVDVTTVVKVPESTLTAIQRSQLVTGPVDAYRFVHTVTEFNSPDIVAGEAIELQIQIGDTVYLEELVIVND